MSSYGIKELRINAIKYLTLMPGIKELRSIDLILRSFSVNCQNPMRIISNPDGILVVNRISLSKGTFHDKNLALQLEMLVGLAL